MGFFEDVRRVVRKIPRGRAASYGEVARAAGYPQSARMVARALRDSDKHGLPWQRVVGAGGRIVLPGEAGLHQRLLLELEGVTFSGARIRWDLHEYRFGRVPLKQHRGRSGLPGERGRKSAEPRLK
jgi:methylated-DNA-protein-cysteine methyltransferase related protein